MRSCRTYEIEEERTLSICCRQKRRTLSIQGSTKKKHRDKKTLMIFFAFPGLSGKFGNNL
jgi:hypothetical protein